MPRAAVHLLIATLIHAQVDLSSMIYGGLPTVRFSQTKDGPSAGLWGKGRAQLGRNACKHTCSPRRHSTAVVAKLATTVRSVSSKDDDEISDRQRRSSRNTASTSGRNSHADDAAEPPRGRAAASSTKGRSRQRDVSPDASWSYAFASPNTKTRPTRSSPGNGKSPAPGQRCKQV